MRNKTVVIRNHKGVLVGSAIEKKEGTYVLPVVSKSNLIEEYYYEVDGKNSKDVLGGKVRVQWARLKGTVTWRFDSKDRKVSIHVALDPAVPVSDKVGWELYRSDDYSPNLQAWMGIKVGTNDVGVEAHVRINRNEETFYKVGPFVKEVKNLGWKKPNSLRNYRYAIRRDGKFQEFGIEDGKSVVESFDLYPS